MMAYWDNNQVCRFANKAYYNWFGKTDSQMRGITLKELLGSLYEKNLPYIERAYAGEKQIFEREITTPDGVTRFSLATYSPHLADGKVQGIFVHVADVSVLKRLEMELREAKLEAEKQAAHDFLTGLPNRVMLFDRIAQAFSLAKRAGSMVAGISLDLDEFKQVNDTYGHAAGDLLLVEVAKRLRQAMREIDTVTRMGGDEFFLLINNVASKTQIEDLAKRLLEDVQRPLTMDGFAMKPTCSLGIAVRTPQGIDEPVQFIMDSDRALHSALVSGGKPYEDPNENSVQSQPIRS